MLKFVWMECRCVCGGSEETFSWWYLLVSLRTDFEGVWQAGWRLGEAGRDEMDGELG